MTNGSPVGQLGALQLTYISFIHQSPGASCFQIHPQKLTGLWAGGDERAVEQQEPKKTTVAKEGAWAQLFEQKHGPNLVLEGKVLLTLTL